MRKIALVLPFIAACSTHPVAPSDGPEDKIDFTLSGAATRELVWRQTNDFPACAYPCLLIVR